MAEQQFNPVEEGQRIANQYLSKRGWAAEWRRTLNRELYPGFQREELEEKEQKCDQLAEEAEDIFSQNVERWRRNPDPLAKEVLRTIVNIMGARTDLGFFAKRIVDRLKREWREI